MQEDKESDLCGGTAFGSNLQHCYSLHSIRMIGPGLAIIRNVTFFTRLYTHPRTS